MRNNLFLPWPEGALRRRKVLGSPVFVHKSTAANFNLSANASTSGVDYKNAW